MAGILGENIFDDGLLALSSGLLQASAPSLTPVNNGMAFGMGLDAYQKQMEANRLKQLQQLELMQKLQPASPWAKIDPKDYTPDSLAAYQQTGNPADLRALPATGSRPQIAQLYEFLDTLPPGDPRRALVEAQIKKLGTVSPGVSVQVGDTMLPTSEAIARDDMLQRAENARAYIGQIRQDGRAGINSIADFDKALALLDEVQTGWGQDTILTARKIGNLLGFDVGDISSAEQLQTLLGDQVMARVAQTKGAVSEREMALFTEYSANFGKTPEGNRKILEFQRAKARRDVELSRLVNRMQDAGRTSIEIEQAIHDHINDPANSLANILTAPSRGTGAVMQDAAVQAALNKYRVQ